MRVGRVLLVAGLLLATGLPLAAGGASLQEARDAYQRALGESDRSRRTRSFAEAELLLRQLAVEQPDRPELLTDWGNAALGAQDLGRATLAFRRALRLDPANRRASKNLSWVRSRAPRWLPQPSTSGTVDSLFFWRDELGAAGSSIAAGAVFALTLALLAPWGFRATRKRPLRRIAFVTGICWLLLVVPDLVEPDATNDAVLLLDGIELRSADSQGAPAALDRPLPAGTEITVLEERDLWTRVRLADGTRGWLHRAALERIGQ